MYSFASFFFYWTRFSYFFPGYCQISHVPHRESPLCRLVSTSNIKTTIRHGTKERTANNHRKCANLFFFLFSNLIIFKKISFFLFCVSNGFLMKREMAIDRHFVRFLFGCVNGPMCACCFLCVCSSRTHACPWFIVVKLPHIFFFHIGIDIMYVSQTEIHNKKMGGKKNTANRVRGGKSRHTQKTETRAADYRRLPTLDSYSSIALPFWYT